jgi:hypothetical protein
MSFARAAALLPTLLLFLFGCAGEPVVSYSYFESAYEPLEFAGSVAVLVRGNPYAVPQSQLDGAVIDALGPGIYGVGSHLVAAPAGAIPLYRIVLMFGPPAGLGPFALCSRPPPDTAAVPLPADRRVTVIAAACRSDQDASCAEGTIALGAGPGSDEFRRGLVRFALTLLPTSNPSNTPDTNL